MEGRSGSALALSIVLMRGMKGKVADATSSAGFDEALPCCQQAARAAIKAANRCGSSAWVDGWKDRRVRMEGEKKKEAW